MKIYRQLLGALLFFASVGSIAQTQKVTLEQKKALLELNKKEQGKRAFKTYNAPINPRLNLLRILLLYTQGPKVFSTLFPNGRITREGVAKFFCPSMSTDEVSQISLGKIQDEIDLLLHKLASPKDDSGIKRYSATQLEAFLAAENNNEFYDYIANPEAIQKDNPIRKRMAGHWIRNAALRIFSDDLRSFLELIVNARDAMLPPEKAVGKFGMGFFSILSFLAHKDTQGATIQIETRQKDPVNKILCYRITIEKAGDYDTWDDKDISFTFHAYPGTATDKPGTTIKITPNVRGFSEDSLRKLRTYIYYIKPMEEVKITLAYRFAPDAELIKEELGASKAGGEILVSLTPNELGVSDEGPGMSMETILRNLLIPSASTKEIESLASLRNQAWSEGVKPPTLVKWGGKPDKNSSYFSVTVNGIVVVHKKIDTPIYDNNKQVTDIEIQMPQATQLTIARDELTILPNRESFEEKWITNVIEQTIGKITSGAQNIPLETLMGLYRGLSAWEDQTALHYIKGRFTNIFKKALEEKLSGINSPVIAVPAQHFSALKNIIEILMPNTKYIFLPLEDDLVNNNFSKLEQILVNAAKNNIKNDFENIKHDALEGKIAKETKIIFVDDTLLDSKIKSFSLRTVLFVPCSFFPSSGNREKRINKLFDKFTTFTEYPILTDELAASIDLPLIVSTITDDIVWKIGNKPLTDYYLWDFYWDVFKKSTWENSPHIDISDPIVHSHRNQNLFKNQNDILIAAGYGVCDLYYDRTTKITAVKIKEKPIKDFHKYVVFFSPDQLYIYNAEQRLTESEADLANEKFLEQSSNLSTLLKDPAKCAIFMKNHISLEMRPNRLGIFATNSTYNKILYSSLLYRFGITAPNTPGALYLHMNGKLKPIWPLSSQTTNSPTLSPKEPQAEKEAKKEALNNLIATLLFYTYGDPRLIALDNNSIAMVNDFYDKSWKDRNAYKSKSAMSKFLKENNSLFGKDCKYRLLTFPGFVGCKGMSEVEIEKEINYLKQKAQKALGYTYKLQDIIPNLSIVKYFIDLAKIEQKCEDNNKIKELLNVIYALYDKYFNMQDSDLTGVYGKATIINSINPFDDIPALVAAKFLKTFSKSASDATDKLITFQKEDFYKKTNLDTRTEDLKENKLIIPSFLSNTPISVLASLWNEGNGLSVDVIAALIKQSRSSEELLFTAHLLLHNNNSENVKNLGPDAAEKIEFLLEHYLQKRVDKEKIKEVELKNREQVELGERLKTFDREESSKILQEYFKSQRDGSVLYDMSAEYNKHNALITSKHQPFTLKRLMKAHSIGAGLSTLLAQNKLTEAINIIKNTKGQIESNKIMQCVEVGTERSPLQASITETLQNSLDAVKGFTGKRSTHNIQLTIGQIPGRKPKLSSAYYSIKDDVGMPNLESLLADIIIPDYSRKSPTTGNIGDMGNGLFQLYKDADEVLFITRITDDPNKVFTLQVLPQRNKDNLVDDLELRCAESKPIDGEFGTRIVVKFREQPDRITTMNLLTAKDFIRNCAGATNLVTTNKPVIISLKEGASNSKPINTLSLTLENIPTTLTSDRDGTEYPVKIYQRGGTLLDSYLTTGGVPFRPLGEFLREVNLLPLNLIPLINSGIVIDLPLGTYQPVQSRTHVKISDANKKKLRELLLEVVYWRELERIQDDTDMLDSYLDNFSGAARDFYGLVLNPDDKTKWDKIYKNFIEGSPTPFVGKKLFFTNYQTRSVPKKSFYDLIDHGYKSLVEKLNQQKKLFDESISKLEEDLQVAIIMDETNISNARTQFDAFTKEKEIAWEKEKNTTFDDWKTKDLGKIGLSILINKVVMEWFDKKVKTMKLKIPWFEDLSFKDKNGKVIKTDEEQRKETLFCRFLLSCNESMQNLFFNQPQQIKTLLNAYLTTYIASLNDAKKQIKYPKIAFYYKNVKNDDCLGNFSPAEGIRINLKDVSIANIFEHIGLLANSANKLQNITAHKTYKELFGCVLGNPGTVTHELEHARRDEASERGLHTNGETDPGKFESFDACANYYAQKAINSGCLERWRELIITSLANSGIQINEKLISDLRELENIDKKLLIENIGFKDENR